MRKITVKLSQHSHIISPEHKSNNNNFKDTSKYKYYGHATIEMFTNLLAHLLITVLSQTITESKKQYRMYNEILSCKMHYETVIIITTSNMQNIMMQHKHQIVNSK